MVSILLGSGSSPCLYSNCLRKWLGDDGSEGSKSMKMPKVSTCYPVFLSVFHTVFTTCASPGSSATETKSPRPMLGDFQIPGGTQQGAPSGPGGPTDRHRATPVRTVPAWGLVRSCAPLHHWGAAGGKGKVMEIPTPPEEIEE